MQIIDGNSVGWAMHSATKLTYAGLQTQSIYGTIRMLRDTLTSHPGEPIVVLWDGQAKHRFELLPNYKGDREARRQADPVALADHADYKKATQVLKKAIELLGINQIVHPDFEADDLAGVVIQLPGKHRLVTGDTDWLQYVSDRVDWFDPRSGGKFIGMRNFHEMTGYATPGEYIEGKALIGDGTDSIPGVDDFADKKAAAFMAKWQTVQRFFDAVDNGTHAPAQRKSKSAKTQHPEQFIASPEGRALFARNMALMDLRKPHPGVMTGLQITQGAPSGEKVRTLFERLGFVSLLRDFDTWAYPFGIRAGRMAA